MSPLIAGYDHAPAAISLPGPSVLRKEKGKDTRHFPSWLPFLVPIPKLDTRQKPEHGRCAVSLRSNGCKFQRVCRAYTFVSERKKLGREGGSERVARFIIGMERRPWEREDKRKRSAVQGDEVKG